MLVGEPRDKETLFRHLISLVDDPALLRRTAEKGYATISRYGWEEKTAQLEKLLVDGSGLHDEGEG